MTDPKELRDEQENLREELFELFNSFETVVIHAINSPKADYMNGVVSSYVSQATRLIEQYTATKIAEAEKLGRAVGQYQAADRIYGDVYNLYMFGDNPTSAKAKSIAEWSAVSILQHTEAFMNDNQAAYKDYLTRLTEQEDSND